MGENVFSKMEQEGNMPAENPAPIAPTSGGEFNYEQLSDTAVGDKKKYDRVDLDKQVVTVSGAKVFLADTTQPPVIALSDKTKKYYPCNFIINYDTPNQDREYLSGCIQHVNRDGKLSEPNFWYEGASNQVATLWEKVAAFKKKEPKELSAREFMAFLNNKPKALIESIVVKFKGNAPKKNFVGSFVN